MYIYIYIYNIYIYNIHTACVFLKPGVVIFGTSCQNLELKKDR